MDLSQAIARLKEEKDVVILAHYYTTGDIQAVADFVGDSYALSVAAAEAKEGVILFAGVEFMGESAKILSPDKIVLIPEPAADCPMARMIEPADIAAFKAEHPQAAVVTYINSTAETKALADVCVTSANALKVVSKLDAEEIFFVPDRNLGRYIAEHLPEKTFYFHPGYCPIHDQITPEHVAQAKAAHPGAKVLMHPECRPETLAAADYIGSTTGIIAYPGTDGGDEYIIATENGVLYELNKQYPDKTFYMIYDDCICEDMKMITLEKVYETLVNFDHQMEMDSQLMDAASRSLECMLELAK